MKLISFTNLLVLGLVLSVGAVGCRKKPTALTDIPNAPVSGVPDVGLSGPIQPTPLDISSGTNAGMIPLNNPAAHEGWPEDAQIFKPYTVHFDFDSSAIKSSEKSKVASVADHLKNNPQTAVRVEGNCDERGTEEYNRSLGERRALALREELVRLGIDPSRVDTKSWGEDNPVDPGHNETAWALNRRGDFILLTPP